MSWITLRLRVTTPLFNGHDDEPLRVSSLRGAMRYWFRALAGTKVGPSIRTLRRLEDEVFGSTTNPSPVRMRLGKLPQTRRNPCLSFLDSTRFPDQLRKEPAIGYLMGQGLGTIVKGRYQITRPYVFPDHKYFELKMALSEDSRINALTLASLWMVCAYGGVGSRVRRGFGKIRIIGATLHDQKSVTPWTESSLQTPGLTHYKELDDRQRLQPIGPLDDCLEPIDDLLKQIGDPDEARTWREDEIPTYPVFSSKWTCAGLSAYSASSWAELLAHVGRQYRLSRATADNSASRTNYWPKVKTPERDAVLHGNSNRFPLGALGLPVVYSKDKVTVGERRASPLWMHPVMEDGEWRLFSFAFHNTFLPAETEVRLSGKIRKSVIITDDDVVNRTSDWIQRMRHDPAPYRLPGEEG